VVVEISERFQLPKTAQIRASSLAGSPDWGLVAEKAEQALEDYWETTSNYPALFPDYAEMP
jgi:hypothetical protein